VTPIHTAPADGGAAYGLWAAGRDYKVSFHDGMTWIPYLGADYPHNQPWSWSTASVRWGQRELVTHSAALRADDTVCSFDLGEVRERYEVREEGLHQTFVVETRPRGAYGDLVVRGAVGTDLVAAPQEPSHGPLVFSDRDGAPVLSYGAATAVDADGQTHPMRTSFDGSTIGLHVEGAWLERARFPVTLDPLLGNVSLFATANPPTGGDVLREDEGVSLNVWFTYSRAASAQDRDLWLWRNDDGFGATSDLAFSDITNSWSSDEGRLAGNGATDKVVVAFTRVFLNQPTSTARIRWHAHLRTNLNLDVTVGAYNPPLLQPQLNDWRVDIGGTMPFSQGTQACLIWQREDNGVGNGFANTARSNIYAAILDLATGVHGALGPVFAVRDRVSYDYERPVLNRHSMGGAGRYQWVAAWMETDNAIGDDWDVTCAQVSSDASVQGNLALQPNTSFHKMGPVLDGTDGRYLVGFTSVPLNLVPGKPSEVFGTVINTARVDASPTAGLALRATGGLLALTVPRFRLSSCAYDHETRSHWLLSYENAQAADTGLLLVGYRGETLRTETLYNGAAGTVPGPAGVSFNDDSNEFVCTFPVAQAGNQPVYGNVFQYPTTLPPVTGGVGCSTASIGWSQPGGPVGNQLQLIGSEFSGVRVSGAPGRSIHFLLLSTERVDQVIVNPLVGAGCRLLIDNTAPAFVGALDFRVGGDVFWQLPIPEGIAPDVFHFQDWHTDVSGGAFVSTVRLSVPVIK